MNVLNTFGGKSYYFLRWSHPTLTSPAIMRFFSRKTESYISPAKAQPVWDEGLFLAWESLCGAGMPSILGNAANPSRDSAAKGTNEVGGKVLFSFGRRIFPCVLWSAEYTLHPTLLTATLILTFNSSLPCWESAKFSKHLLCTPRGGA